MEALATADPLAGLAGTRLRLPGPLAGLRRRDVNPGRPQAARRSLDRRRVLGAIGPGKVPRLQGRLDPDVPGGDRGAGCLALVAAIRVRMAAEASFQQSQRSPGRARLLPSLA